MNLVCGGLQISNIPKLSFSWAQGATKNRSIHHSAPVLYFSDHENNNLVAMDTRFLSMHEKHFPSLKKCSLPKVRYSRKTLYYVPLNPCENQHNILLHLPPYKFVWMMVVCFYSFLMMMHIRLLFNVNYTTIFLFLK